MILRGNLYKSERLRLTTTLYAEENWTYTWLGIREKKGDIREPQSQPYVSYRPNGWATSSKLSHNTEPAQRVPRGIEAIGSVQTPPPRIKPNLSQQPHPSYGGSNIGALEARGRAVMGKTSNEYRHQVIEVRVDNDPVFSIPRRCDGVVLEL